VAKKAAKYENNRQSSIVNRRSNGFSLMEVLVALAIVLILIGALVGAGSYVRTRANIDLTKGMLETLSTALEQYYDDQTPNAFPFGTATGVDTTPPDGKDDYLLIHLETDLGGTVIGSSLLEKDGNNTDVSTASSAALFYFLDKDPASRSIVDAVPNTLITNKDAFGVPIKITIAGTAYDLPRYIDPWGMSIRYVYLPGTAFPVLTSAGPDKVFDTPDDVTSK
jgi:prepilin-type N-terminal cleavage/methylation domain-containing protein